MVSVIVIRNNVSSSSGVLVELSVLSSELFNYCFVMLFIFCGIIGLGWLVLSVNSVGSVMKKNMKLISCSDGFYGCIVCLLWWCSICMFSISSSSGNV